MNALISCRFNPHRRSILPKWQNVVVIVIFDDFSESVVAGYDSDLKRSMIGVVLRTLIRAAKQKQPGAGLLSVESADVQRGVAGIVARVHVGAVQDEKFEVTRKPQATRIVNLEPSLSIGHTHVGVVME